MLTINAIECGIGDTDGTSDAADYVLSRSDAPAAFARGSYYADASADGDGPVLWHGAPAALGHLGLRAGTKVERRHLIAALKGQHVGTGEQVRRPGSRTVERDDALVVEHVVKSVDLTFSVPKSVSVVWSQASPGERARIEADVLQAARETLDFMATRKDCVHRRDSDGNRYREPAAGVAAALSLHVTARRAAGDEAPAPQLHVHGVVVGLLRRDGALVTPDPWAWFRGGAAREGGALGRGVLAESLAERGYEIEAETGKHGRYFELSRVPEALRTALSGRSREVATRKRALELAQGRRLTGAALSVLAKETRAEKVTMDHARITSWWDAIASEHGFGRREADELRSLSAERPVGDAAVVEAVLRRLAEEGPTVRTAEARAIALESAAGRVTPGRALELLAELQERRLVIPLEDDRVTTRPVRQLEAEVLRRAQQATRTGAPLPVGAVDAGIKVAERSLGNELDAEQLRAVREICAGSNWSNLVGRAGVGKGPTLEAVARAHEIAGWQVLACAVDGTTTQRLARQVGGRGYTIDGLTTRVATGRLVPNAKTLILIDEASKVDTGRWSQLSALVEAHDLRLVAVGDEGQLQAIQLPGLFTELCRRTPTVELTQVRRHRDERDPTQDHPWLGQYQSALHGGHGQEAVAILQEHEALHVHDTRAEAMVALVEDWNSWRKDYAVGETMLLIHGTNGDVDTVNQLAQEHRRAEGELGDPLAAPDRDYELHEGDRIVLRGAPLYLRSGDRIENGTFMTIAAVDRLADSIAVVVDQVDGPSVKRTIQLSILRDDALGERRPALRLAYAMHPNPAQGATVSRTAALGHPVADRNAVYVADTRARYGHAVHLAREDFGTDGTDADRLERYAATISDSRARRASISYDVDHGRRVASTRTLER